MSEEMQYTEERNHRLQLEANFQSFILKDSREVESGDIGQNRTGCCFIFLVGGIAIC